MSALGWIAGGDLEEDYIRYKALRHCGFVKLMVAYPEFRYQLYYRLRCYSKLWRFLLRPLQFSNGLNLYIRCSDIDGGLFIEHGFSTIIVCRHIGKNCLIHQQVTIGFNNAGTPFIGDNVKIYAGAKILGNVRIGNDVVVGANAVVVKDIPDHSVVVGVPARIIKTRTSEFQEWKRIDN